MFFRVICVVAFFGLLNEVNSAALNPKEVEEEILAAQEEATLKVLSASLAVAEVAKLNNIVEVKTMDYYNAADNKNKFVLKVELVRKVTDSQKKRLENRLNWLSEKSGEDVQKDIVKTKDSINQIEEMEKIAEQTIKNLTAIESDAKVEWETFEDAAHDAMMLAEDMKKEAVKTVVKALKFTAANSEDLAKNYPKLATLDAAQKACVDYFKNRIEELVPGLSESPDLYEYMKNLWIKGQKEFVKSSA